jgi:hypothetical protein
MNDRWIVEQLASLAAKDRAIEVPPEIEARVLAAFDAPAPRARQWVPVWAGVAAASLLAGAILLQRPQPAPRAPERPFSQIPYVVPPAPYERTRVMRMEVPVAALIAAGFEVHMADTGAAVPADVLFGQDGRALAIRLVSNQERRIGQ